MGIGTVVAAPEAEAGALRAGRRGVWLALVAIVVLGPIVGPMTAQPASRLALTAALGDHHTVDLGQYGSILGVDHAVYRGRLRSDKGPLQPVLAVGAYVAERLVGADAPDAAHKRANLTLWWITVWSAVIPFALLLALMRRAAARVSPTHATAVAVALGAGSILMPHSVNLYAHALCALLGFAAYEVVTARPLNSRRAAWAGALAGAAVATEYELMIVAVIVGVIVLGHRRPGLVGACAAGAAGPLAILAAYQWRAFGAPWHTPFAYYAGTLGGTTRGGYTFPRLDWFADAVIGTRGLLLASPIVVLGAAAAIAVAVDRAHDGGVRRDAVVAVAVLGTYLALVSGWTGTPMLEEPGPRYLIPAIPFLAAPLAAMWPQWRSLCRLAAGYGIALMAGATLTFLLVAHGDTPIHAYAGRVAGLHFLPTVWSIGFGRAGAVLYVASAAVAIGAYMRTDVRPR